MHRRLHAVQEFVTFRRSNLQDCYFYFGRNRCDHHNSLIRVQIEKNRTSTYNKMEINCKIMFECHQLHVVLLTIFNAKHIEHG